jgi:large subunit ribosomal protein L23
MALTIYDIIRGPVTASSKAYMLNKKLHKLMVYVHPDATKAQIKEAVQKLFNVEVTKVNTLSTGPKSRRIGQRLVVRPGKKKAIISLKDGQALNLFNQSGTSDVIVPEVVESSTNRS